MQTHLLHALSIGYAACRFMVGKRFCFVIDSSLPVGSAANINALV